MSAPLSSPLSYGQAAAVAAAMAAAGSSTPDPVAVAAAMSEQIISKGEQVASWAKKAIRQLWATVNPYDEKQVLAFAAQAAAIMESAQTAAGRVAAAAQAQQLASVGVVVNGVPTAPVDVRAPAAIIKRGQLVLHHGAASVDYAGTDGTAEVSKADMSTQGVFTRPAAVFRYAKSQDAADAAEQAGQRIDSLVDDNLMLAQRLAQQQVLVQAVDLDSGRTRNGVKIIGYRRIIHPELSRSGTCGMCIAASDRIYKVAELMPIHAHCKCTIAAVTEDYDPADDLNAVDLNQLYKAAGGTSAAHLKRTRYKVDDHGELGPVLVPDKTYKPRSDKSKVRAAGTGTSGTTESKADVAARHVPLLEQNLANLREMGHGEDSPQVTYHKEQIDRLRKDLPAMASGGGGGGKPPTTKPPVPAAGGGDGGGEGPQDRLNSMFADQTAAASAGQRASARRWQGKDRYYEQVQAAVSGGEATNEARQVADDLRDLAQPLTTEVQVWRGIRSIEDTFGAGVGDLESQPAQIVNRFMATSVHEQVARDEFTRPGRHPAMMRITARAGVKAVWLPPIGDADTAYQGELLFRDGFQLRILNVDTSGNVPVIEVEVSRP
jgi:hypothetical protein